MRGVRRCLAATSAAATLVGCTLLTDLSGFSSATVVTSGDGSAPNDTLEASTEASADAADATDSVTPPSSDCATSHFFCTNFDQRPLVDEWDVVAPGNGTVDRIMAASVSAPFSLVVTHPDGNPAAAPRLTKTIPATGIGGLRCSFRYRRDMVDNNGVLVVLIVDFKTATSEHLFAEIKDGKTAGRVYLAATQPDGGVIDDFPIIPTFASPLASWASVEWTLDLRALRSTLTRDKELIDQRSIGNFAAAQVTDVKLSLGLGNFRAPASPWQVRFDDFVCEALA